MLLSYLNQKVRSILDSHVLLLPGSWVLKFSSSWFWRSFCYLFNDSMPSPWFLLSTPGEDCISSVFVASFLRNPNAKHFSEIWVSPVTCHRPRFHKVSDPNTEQLFIFGSCTEFLVGAEQAVVQKHNGRCVIFCCHYLVTLVQTFTVVFWNSFWISFHVARLHLWFYIYDYIRMYICKYIYI